MALQKHGDADFGSSEVVKVADNETGRAYLKGAQQNPTFILGVVWRDTLLSRCFFSSDDFRQRHCLRVSFLGWTAHELGSLFFFFIIT